ncbi:hypothetical protein C8F01DRAFT_987319, partial [Mycena amicta]
DGNIVLQAGEALYRVYRGTLAMHSSVFKDMLSFPQPEPLPDADLVDGHPLVRLPDLEVEVTPFLKALLFPTFFMPYPAKTDFLTIYGCLRLSTKYDVDFLRRRALAHFSSVYRPTLEEYDSEPLHTWEKPIEDDDDDCMFLLCAIALASEVDAPWVLPGLFYDLTTAFDFRGAEIVAGGAYEGIPVVLAASHHPGFWKGLDTQLKATVSLVAGLSDSEVENQCETPTTCPLERLRLVRVLLRLMDTSPRNHLQLWTPNDWLEYPLDSCGVCMEEMKQTQQTARLGFWDRLPEIYGLPSWEELKAKRAAAIGDDIALSYVPQQ